MPGLVPFAVRFSHWARLNGSPPGVSGARGVCDPPLAREARMPPSTGSGQTLSSYPGLVPLLSGSAVGQSRAGLGRVFGGARRPRSASCPSCPNAPLRQAQGRLFRHTRTCSGYLSQAALPGGRMDARNKSGHDDMGGGHDGNRARPPGVDPSPDPAEPLETRLNPGHALCPTKSKPDSNGLVPGISLKRLCRAAV